jgi:bla regulator protein blaR1
MSVLLDQLSAAARWAGRASLEASLLIGLILLAQALLRDRLSAQWRFALWSLLLLRLALPWTPPSPTSVFNLLPGKLSSRPAAIAGVPADVVPHGAPVGTPAMHDAAPGTTAASSSHAWLQPEWLAAMWAAGVLVVLASAGFQSFTMARAVRRRRFATDQETLDLLEDCKEASGIHAYVALAETDRVSCPALFGILRPRLLLPPGTLPALSRDQLRHVFLHELAHLKRWDIAINWVMTFLQALHWFNPLVWYAFARMRADRELACDDVALSHARPGESDDYGRTFIYLLEKYAQPRRLPALAGVLEKHEHMKRRIAMIARFNPSAAPRPAIAVALFLVLGAVCLTSAWSEIDRDKAEMMGRVDDFFMHNFRDVTARKSLEWGEVEPTGANRSIRYMYEARIWDRDTKIMNQVFTFDADGKFVEYKNVEGYPKPKEVANPATKEGMQKLVEEFFANNYRDITARETIEWGDVEKTADGNYSIRYKANATIWDKDKKVLEKVFTFTPDGKYVSANDVAADSAAAQQRPEEQASGTGAKRPAWIPASSTISPDGRIVDKIDVPFENDPAVVGHWTSVDFVASPEQFKPGRKQWRGDLYLKELEFQPEGQFPQRWLTWSKGLVMHNGNQTAAAYQIRELDGAKYMTLEWKSGDYIIRHEKPSYYVLKKD